MFARGAVAIKKVANMIGFCCGILRIMLIILNVLFFVSYCAGNNEWRAQRMNAVI